MRNVLLFALAAALFLRADLNPSVNFAPLPASTLAVTALSAAATTVTATLPLVTGQFHYITSIAISRSCTGAITGTALLAVTTTNLPGSLAWTSGNACAVGSTNQDMAMSFSSPLKSSVAGTATTLVAPSAGALGQYRLTVTYYAAP
jgi:hypothetical protein